MNRQRAGTMNDTDWRTTTMGAPAGPPRPRGPRGIPYGAVDPVTKIRGPAKPEKPEEMAKKLVREDMIHGAVLWIPGHANESERNINRNGFITNPRLEHTLTYIGHWVFSKKRKWVIVERFEDHFVALPITTNGGRGLTDLNQPSRLKKNIEEYLGIRDADNPNPAPSQNALDYVLARREPAFRGPPYDTPDAKEYISDSAYIDWTKPDNFPYDMRGVKEAQVIPEHVRLVRHQYHSKYCVNQNLPPTPQLPQTPMSAPARRPTGPARTGGQLTQTPIVQGGGRGGRAGGVGGRGGTPVTVTTRNAFDMLSDEMEVDE